MSTDSPIQPVRKSIEVTLGPAETFRLFTDAIDSWWPLATHSVGQADATACHFEGREGGRVYETHKDGSIHLWGMVTVWEPSVRVVFSWHPGRGADTAQEVELRFVGTTAGTRVELEHRGWEVLGERAGETRDAYDSGWVGVLDTFAARCAA